MSVLIKRGVNVISFEYIFHFKWKHFVTKDEKCTIHFCFYHNLLTLFIILWHFVGNKMCIGPTIDEINKWIDAKYRQLPFDGAVVGRFLGNPGQTKVMQCRWLWLHSTNVVILLNWKKIGDVKIVRCSTLFSSHIIHA